MVQRTLSVRVLAISVVAVAVLGGAALGLQRWQVSRTAKTFLAHAQVQEQAANWHKAAEYFDRYLRLLPTDADARVKLARAYGRGAVTLPQKRQAVNLYFRALGAGASDDEIPLREQLAGLLVETGRYLEAEQEARKVLATQPDRALAHRALGLSLWNQVNDGSLVGKRTAQVGVLAAVAKARDRNPADVDLAVVLASLYRDQPAVVTAESPQSTESDLAQQADACLDKLVASAASDPKAWLARHLYRVQYKLPDAESDLAHALALVPDDPAVLMTAAAAAYRSATKLGAQTGQESAAQAQFTQARDYYAKLAATKNVTLVPQWHLGLGDAELGLGEVDQALATWRKGIKLFDQPTVQVEFQTRIADTLLAEQRFAEAEPALNGLDSLLQGLDASVSRDRRVAMQQAQDLRRATWFLSRQQPLAAVPLLRQVISRLATGDVHGNVPLRAWFLLGQACGALGEWSEAASAYDRAAVIQPRLVAAHAAAANAWLMAGRSDLASERAEEALAIQPTAPAWFTLVAAQTQVQGALPPGQQLWRRCDEALAALEQATAEQLGQAPWKVALLKADYLRAKGQTDQTLDHGNTEAGQALRDAEGKYPSDAAFWAILVPYYEQIDTPADADRALAHLRALPNAGVLAPIAAARLATSRQEFDQARAILEQATKSVGSGDTSKLRAELLNVFLAKNDYPLARSLLVQLQREEPQSLLHLRRLAEIDLETKNVSGLLETEQKLAAIVPLGTPLAGYYRACRLLLQSAGDDPQSLRDALAEQSRVKALRPGWAEAVSLGGMIEQRLGRLEAAIAAYKDAIELGERRTLVFEQLIGLLDQLNQQAECEKYLSLMQVQLPLSQRLTELAGTHRVKSDRPEEAVAIARQAVERRSDDPLAHVWLGRLLLIIGGQEAAAEAEFRRAIELAPADVRSWNGLFSYHLRRGDDVQARQTLAELVKHVPLEPAQRSFVLAQGYELIGDTEQAEEQYREASKLMPESAVVQLRLAGLLLRRDPAQAEKCLVRALDLDPKSIVARRMLAVVLASRGGEEDLARVESLLADAGVGSRIASEDQRLKAMLLAQRGGTNNLERAVKLLEELVERGVGSGPSDRLILAQLVEALGRLSPEADQVSARFDEARQHLRKVAARPDAEPQHVAALIAFFQRHGRRDEAGLWLDRLEARLSAAPRDKGDPIAQFVNLLLLQGEPTRAAPWLNRLAKTDAQPLRVLALRARQLTATSPDADVSAIVEPLATKLLAEAKDDAQRRQLWTDLGKLYGLAGKHADSERWYRQLATADATQFHHVADAIAKQGRLTEAISYCEQLSETDKTAQPAIAAAAILVDNSATAKDFAQAEPLLLRALAAFPKDQRLLYALGVLRVIQGRYDDSAELFRRVIAIDPKHVQALNNLALVLAENPAGRSEALRLIDKAIEISGTEADLLDTKGAILVYDGQSAEAVTLLEAAARSAGSDPRHNFHLAAAYHGLGRPQDAKVELQSALDRQIENQVLTPTDRRLLEQLKGALGD